MTGADPGSNRNKDNEMALIESKKDKVIEITRASTDIVSALEKAKNNSLLAELAIDLN